jgi:hypothetical protein
MTTLKGIQLPDGSRYLRNLPGSKETDTDFVDAYDRHTLFYDAFYDADTGFITVVGPSFKRRTVMFLKSCVLKVDGVPVEKTIHRISPRTGELEIQSPSDSPQTLRLLHQDAPKTRAQIPIGRSNHEAFAGKNALVAISKNNKLEWIKDWLDYYVNVHGANAVVLFDNGSDAYSLEDLTNTVNSVKGIETAEVISANFMFGPKGTDRTSVNAKFFHLSMFHIANRRFLSKANAVLSVDIDELVTKPGSETIFEAVQNAPHGFLSIPGTWRYAQTSKNETNAIRHGDHILKRVGTDATMGPKWCINPRGELAGRYWRVHGVAGARHFYDHDYLFLHCRQISTSWDYDRRLESEDLFESAPEAALLSAAFGNTA